MGAGSVAEDYGDNFFSSPDALKGTVRQIAKRLYDASFSSDAVAESLVTRLQTVSLSDEFDVGILDDYKAGVNVWA